LEVLLSHNLGYSEIWHGELHAEQPRFEIVTDAVARTSTAKEYTGGRRLYGYVNGDLMYAFDMAAMGHELQPHTHAQLTRQ
ncbi:MAG TPA: FABP family protein, partial [Marmoricola sp.]|nr:FABP family protein [Marmoricola sp.]